MRRKLVPDGIRLERCDKEWPEHPGGCVKVLAFDGLELGHVRESLTERGLYGRSLWLRETVDGAAGTTRTRRDAIEDLIYLAGYTVESLADAAADHALDERVN